MKAWLLKSPAPAEEHPLVFCDVPESQGGPDKLIVEVHACGVCHTDLHVVEGDLDLPVLPLIPGHQVVGRVLEVGASVTGFKDGDRVGIAWLNDTCRHCEFCSSGRENLCRSAKFTGFHVHGGFAERISIDSRYAYHVPEHYDDIHAAPLLCAGIVGFRTVRVGGVQPGERVGIYGFGASAHLVLQVLVNWKCEVFVFTRSLQHRELATKLGACWTGEAGQRPPKLLHRALIYAPAGWIMIEALKDVQPGGVVTSGGIHMSHIPQFPYSLLWEERSLRSVANATRRDGTDFLGIAAENVLQAEVEAFSWMDLPNVLVRLKRSELKAAAVVTIKEGIV